jgi:putative aldouronate transport system substrate-binding protein
MKQLRVLACLMAAAMLVSALPGCGGEGAQSTVDGSGAAASSAAQETAAQKELPDLEVWYTNTGFLEVEQGGPTYQFYKDLTGVGLWQPYVEWNGGTTYQEQLNLRISAGEAPDVFLTINAMEAELVKNGALLDLTDLLAEKAPHLWNLIPQDVWDIVRSYDPSGENRIYMVPQIRDYTLTGGMIRQDWLDKLGLSTPTTQEEFHDVMVAFKEQDPNGNGQADEIPISGRAEAKYMDTLFAMYGVAMSGGNPLWDVYDGELTYAGVTINMRDALQYVSGLYAEGLIDPECLLNDLAAWKGKLASDRCGMYYHWVQASYEYAQDTFNATGAKPDWAVMAPISAPGYEGFYTTQKVGTAFLVVPATDKQDKIDAVMRFFDAFGNTELWDAFQFGVEGMHHDVANGKKVLRANDYTTQENRIIRAYEDVTTVDEVVKFLLGIESEDTAWAIERSIDNLKKNQEYGKLIGGDGLPTSVYDKYPDIFNRTLYVEYASKIITGEYPIEKFDEFVERWHASGGEEVTRAAREWYARVDKE